MKLRESEMKEYILPLLVEIEEACNLRKIVPLLYHNYIVLPRTLTEPQYFTYKRKRPRTSPEFPSPEFHKINTLIVTYIKKNRNRRINVHENKRFHAILIYSVIQYCWKGPEGWRICLINPQSGSVVSERLCFCVYVTWAICVHIRLLIYVFVGRKDCSNRFCVA